MENEYKDEVVIELDRPRVLRASFKVLKKIENMTGLHVMKLGDDLSMQQYALILFCLMEADATAAGEKLTPATVENLLDSYPIGRAIRAINAAFEAAAGDADESPAGGNETKNAQAESSDSSETL